jgi:hypothetical protein
MAPVVFHQSQTRRYVMNDERAKKCLRQVEHIRGHLWHRYSVTVNQVMMATVKHQEWDDFNLTNKKSWLSSFLVSSSPLSRKSWLRTTNYGILDKLRNIDLICRWYWNDATYKWKVHNEKITIISFVLKFRF